MPWVALDDQIFMNKKVARCDPNTKLLYIVGLVYCGHQLTDGYIEQDTLALLAGMAGIDLAIAKQNASKLCSIGLWVATADQWHIPDYLDYNPSRDEVLHKKAVRAAAGKLGGMAKASKSLANATAIARQNPSKTLPPSPSPSDDKEWEQALADMQILGLWSKTDRDRFADMWPDLSGRRDWVGKAITLTRDKDIGAGIPYALKVLANAIHTGKEPGYVNGAGKPALTGDADTRPRVKAAPADVVAAADARQAAYEQQIAEELARTGRIA